MSLVRNLLVSNPTSKYLSLGWNLGSFLGLVLVLQLLTGLLLTLYYSNEAPLSFSSVDYISREVHLGWLVRIMHVNGASLFFGLLYAHFLKALFFSSYRLCAVWLSGLVLLVLSIAVAFLGYVLVNAQMSYWAAVVITSLLGVLPGGGDLLLWVWGGYSVGPATLKLCFTLHYLLPWGLFLLILIHLFLLQGVGSTTPLSYSGPLTMGWFHPYYLVKDGLSLLVLFLFYSAVLLNPYALGDPEMFVEASPLVSPLHIVPEWYFLFAYAILRAQPVKFAGVMLLVSSLVVPSLLCLAPGYGAPWTVVFRVLVWTFIATVILLSWLGQCPVEEPYTLLSILSTSAYFFLLGIMAAVWFLESFLLSSTLLVSRDLFFLTWVVV